MPRRTQNPFSPAVNVRFTVSAEAANARTASLQFFPGAGGGTSGRVRYDWYLSDDANGDSVVATAPSGGVAAGTDGHLTALVTGKSGWGVTEADGQADLTITEAGVKTVYLIICVDGKLFPSAAIAFA